MSGSKTTYREFREGEESRFVSDLVDVQVPSFYHDEGPLFVKLLEEYYEYAHKGGNYESTARNLLKLNDVDEIGEFYEQYRNNSGGNYTAANTAWTSAGHQLLTDVEQLYRQKLLLNMPTTTQSFQPFLKHIVEVYKAKGSDRGIEALMKGIYGHTSEVRRPFDRTFKPSDNVWSFDSYLQATYSPEMENWVGFSIFGVSSGASARVDRIVKRNVNGRLLAQIVLVDISTETEFEHNESIYSQLDPDSRFRIIAGIKEIRLTANGSEFSLGGEVDLVGGNGIEGRAVISEVESFEGLLAFTLTDAGRGYRANSTVIIEGGAGGHGAQLAVGGIEPGGTLLEVCDDIIGALAANSQITIGQTPYVSNSNIGYLEYAGGQQYLITPQLAGANYLSVIDDALDVEVVPTGEIGFLVTLNTGRNYVVAPTVTIVDHSIYGLRIPDGEGGFLGYNANVDVALLANNIITSIKVADHGFGYGNVEFISLDPGVPKGTPASGKLIMGGVATSAGGWTGTESFPDSNQRIHDSDRYQAFSYEIVVPESLEIYENAMNSIAHVAGTKMFGVYQTAEVANTELTNGTEITISESGAASFVIDGNVVTGFDTLFTTEFAANDEVAIGDMSFTIERIDSDTSMIGNNFSHGGDNFEPITFTTINGSLDAANGSTTVTGTDTLFDEQVNPGMVLVTTDDVRIGIVDNVVSNTEITLANTYTQNSLIAQTSVSMVNARRVFNDYILSGEMSINNGANTATGIDSYYSVELNVGDKLFVQSNNMFVGTIREVTSNSTIALTSCYDQPSFSDTKIVRRHKFEKLVVEA
jgi:hypothetical protein